jgi:hypothetical protein
MNRREYLLAASTATTALLSGCSGVLGGPRFETAQKDELLFDEPQSDWPDSELVADHDYNEHFDRCFITPDEDLFIFIDVQIHEEVEQAENAFQQSSATLGNSKEYPLADEAFVGDDGEAARTTFRLSNALGQVLAARVSGLELRPDRERATMYAGFLHTKWTNV